MKLLVAGITFAVTLGMLFLIEAGKLPKEDYAQIIEALKEENTNTVVSATPSRTPISTPIRTPTPTSTSTPTPQNSPAARQTSSTPTPTQTPARTPSPTPLPASLPSSPASSATPTPTPTLTPTPSPTLTPTPEQSEKININTAGLEELDKITGVGPVIAQRIIDYRNSNGPFQKIEDIKEVKGIGDVTFEKMRNEITI